MKKALFLAALASMVTSAAAFAEVPDQVTLRSFAYAGTGCAANTVRTNFPVPGQQFMILWGTFTAAAGVDIPLREARKNCQLNIDLAYPDGWQYTVESTEYHGHVTVAEGTQAVAASYYYFQGESQTVRFGTLFDGPSTREFDVRDSVSDRDQVWSQCTAVRSLNVNYQVRIVGAADGQATGGISFGTDVDGAPAGTLLTLKWRRCVQSPE